MCYVLYPASVKAGHEIEEGLSVRGFVVTRLNTYNTVPVDEVDPMVLRQAVSAPVVAVASPSAVRAWVNLIAKGEWNNSVACIGETTALAAKQLGLKNVYYPSNPGLEGCSKLTNPEAIHVALRLFLDLSGDFRSYLDLPELSAISRHVQGLPLFDNPKTWSGMPLVPFIGLLGHPRHFLAFWDIPAIS
ncbi:hypothetical protein Taro_033198 [Colocasia esculenta]|uniref:Uroporphyrinogen-III synthase n=1 Tax=Colocasia esculenta TaxID=4460 RepID=A0A843VUN3_COLES|nr:hypothetical protein [Colocasia esculenta]